jgi:hypothetical protein
VEGKNMRNEMLQPAPACRWLDIWHKTKSDIWLSHVTSVVNVKQQDGNKKKETKCETKDERKMKRR